MLFQATSLPEKKYEGQGKARLKSQQNKSPKCMIARGGCRINQDAFLLDA
jgi:hypothetical protein